MSAVMTRRRQRWALLAGMLFFCTPWAHAQEGTVGYIDTAIPTTQLRFRFDAGYDNNRPDRAEFFYAKCGCFRIAGLDPRAAGPPLTESRVDFQDISAYLEVATSKRLSFFVETPVRFLNPEQNANTTGYADMNAGFKYAFVADPDRFLTFQFRTYIPSGDADRGLGNDHVSLEPSLLLYQRLGERLHMEAELRDWIPIGGSDFAGNILRYGVGLSYDAIDTGRLRVSPVVELIGWTVLDGRELAVATLTPIEVAAPQDASGDTIVNAKLGVRFRICNENPMGLLSGSDVYVGYGRALTGDVWYKDMLRVEWRLRF